MEGRGKGRHSDVLLKHYKLEKTLGIGLSCKVKGAEHILTGNKVAIKILNRGKIKKLDLEEKVQREIRIMRLFMHPHIIRLYEVIQTQTHIYVVMERANSGELFDYIVQKGRLNDDEARHFFQQIISGVEYCHGNKVVHRDLKPENLLLDSNLNIKIIDFGLCNEMRDGHFLKTNCGSPNYAAPEVISSRLYVGPEIDVWSCGVILYALLCGTLPFDDANIPNLYKKIKSGMYAVPGHLSAGARDLIQRILTVDPMKRVTILQIRQHPWFQVQLPRYLAMPPPDTMQQVRKVHEGILQEVINLGFDRNQLIESLLNRTQDQATVSYYSLLDHKLCASNGYLEDGGFSRMHFYESATSAFACPLQGALSDQGCSHRPNFPDENKWTLGLQSTACPHEIMKEVVRALTELRVCWRSIGHYNLRCKWQPGLHGNSESYSTNPVRFDDRISNGFGSVENNVVPENLFNAVKFELQIYKTMDEKFLLDVRRVDGPHLVFLSLCASLLHQLRVR